MASPPNDAASKRVQVDIEEDAVVEILKRLPVKSTCRFRCVCKSWNSLISSSFFIRLHHKYTFSNTPADQKPYLLVDNDVFHCHKNLRCKLYRPPQTTGDIHTYLDLPSSISRTEDHSAYKVAGVINGVVCIATSTASIVLWNPAIRKQISHRYIPKDGHYYVGFGFNEAKNDFKVVVISCSGPWYDVLSVEDGTWKRKSLPDSIYEVCYTRRRKLKKVPLFLSPGYFIDKSKTIYWAALLEDDTSVLLLFDCESEEMRTMELPRELAELDPLRLVFLKHRDRLSARIKTEQLPRKWEKEVWMMMMDEEESGSFCNCTKWERHYTTQDSLFGLDVIADAVCVGSGDDGYVHQPLRSQVLDQTLFLMNVKATPPLPVEPPPELPNCSGLMRYVYQISWIYEAILEPTPPPTLPPHGSYQYPYNQ